MGCDQGLVGPNWKLRDNKRRSVILGTRNGRNSRTTHSPLVSGGARDPSNQLCALHTFLRHVRIGVVRGWALRSRASSGKRNWSTCAQDRKSTRLNSSHQIISYAVFCLKKK